MKLFFEQLYPLREYIEGNVPPIFGFTVLYCMYGKRSLRLQFPCHHLNGHPNPQAVHELKGLQPLLSN